MHKILLPCLAAAAAVMLGTATARADSPAHPSATFHVDTMTAIPGRTLPPGTYHIRVVDHLSDRYVLRVDGPNGEHTMFLGIPSEKLPKQSGEVMWSDPASGATYVRGWEFPGMSEPLEFAYPKNDAVAVAKANNAEVPAIDPQSDGLPTKTALDKDQAKMVTLWLLTPTTVGPSAPAGIAAQRYAAPNNTQIARVERKPPIKRLPHTASSLPIFWLAGLLALMGATGLRVARFGGRQA